MAVEAARQARAHTGIEQEDAYSKPFNQFHLRNVKIGRALVLEEGVDNKIMFSLSPQDASSDRSRYKFRITSLIGGTWTENCSGLVHVEGHSEEGRVKYEMQSVSKLMAGNRTFAGD